MEQRIYRLSRAGGIETNPTTFTQRAGTFASAVSGGGHATLLTRREATGLNGYLIAPPKAVASNAPLHLAHTVGARAEEAELPAGLGDTPAIGRLAYRPSPALRETQSGIDPSELPRLLANAMPEGSWVAVTIRKPSNRERKTYTTWLANRLGTAVPTHHSTSPTAIVVAITAGGSSRDEVRSLLAQVTAGLPGFDLDIGVEFPARRHPAVFGLAAGAALAAATFFGLPHLPAEAATLLPDFLPGLLYGIAVLLGIAGIAAATGRLKSPETKLRHHLDAAAFPPPRPRRTKPRPPRKEQTIKGTRQDANGEKIPFEKFIPASDGDYPLSDDSFLVGPNVVVGIVSPHAGAVSGEAATRARSTPPAMLGDIGPMIGTNADGEAHLSADAMRYGCAVVGRPGSGKAECLDARIPVPVSAKFPSGWALNRELAIGDEVLSPSGGASKIADFSEIFEGDVYEITFSDGQKVKADAGHLWAVSDRTNRRRDGSAYLTTKMSDVDARAQKEAERIRTVAASVVPGTMATGNELGRLSGVGAGALLRFARSTGIDPVRVSTAVINGGIREIGRPRVRFDVAESRRVLMHMADSPSSYAIRRMNIGALADSRDTLLTAKEILVEARVPSPSAVECSTMNSRLKRAGVVPVRDVAIRPISTKPTMKLLDTYPVREMLHRYANHIGAGRRRSPRTQLRTTASLAERVRVSAEGSLNWAVDLSRPIEGNHIDAFVDPYVLGAWLGDGSTDGPAITCFDQPILNEITSAGYQLRARKSSGLYGIIGAIDEFRSLGVIGNKHIPSSYLRASVEQRISLLQGLMDTDGTVDSSGACELTLCNEPLAANALELIRSLGIKCKSTPSDASYVAKDGTRKVTGTRHRMHFTTSLPVFRLPRKLERIPAKTRPTQNLLYVVSVEKVDAAKVRCISVEAADGMYLTHGFIPTHNSQLVRSLFGWHCLERVNPSGRAGYPGTRNTLIAFESKGEGAGKYVQWSHTVGDKALVIDAADPATPAIDMFSVPGDNAAKASFFTNAMRYAFGDQAIGDRSFETLVSVLTAALSVDDELLETMDDRDERLIPAGRSPIFYAHLLLGGHSDATGVELAAAIKAQGVKLRERGTPDLELKSAYAALAPLYEGRTESARRSFLEAPRNKISQLLALENWWTPARRKVTWADIITGHRSVVINTGSSLSGIVLDDSQNQQLSSMLMYSLQNALKRHCSGWLEAGRSVSVFADELSLLAGTSPEVIGWIRDQGRSYGIRAILATQRPEQLGATLRNNFLTYSTLISFAQTDVATAAEVAANVGANGEWSTEDIQHLEPYHVVVRSEVAQRRQSAFIVKLPNFEEDMAGYATVQGYVTEMFPA